MSSWFVQIFEKFLSKSKFVLIRDIVVCLTSVLEEITVGTRTNSVPET